MSVAAEHVLLLTAVLLARCSPLPGEGEEPAPDMPRIEPMYAVDPRLWHGCRCDGVRSIVDVPRTYASVVPSVAPNVAPSVTPNVTPSVSLSVSSSLTLSVTNSVTNRVTYSVVPSATPSVAQRTTPSVTSSVTPSVIPSVAPSATPSVAQRTTPSVTSSVTPSVIPSDLTNASRNTTPRASRRTPGRHPGLICSCSGPQLLSIPEQLTRSHHPVSSLVLQGAGMEVLKRKDFNCCRQELQELTLMDLKKLSRVEDAILQDMNELRSLAMYRLTKLDTLPKRMFQVHLPRLRILRIVQTGLKELPLLMMGNQILEMVDFETNNISRLTTHSVVVRTSKLMLGYNLIETVAARAFESSQIAELSLKANGNLHYLHPEAFLGIESLRRLDLSGTSIRSLPTRGLEHLEHLLLRDTHLLKVFPAAFHFKGLQRADLTYPYHCCAFSHPAAHRPEEYADYQEKLREVRERCAEFNHSRGSMLSAGLAGMAGLAGLAATLPPMLLQPQALLELEATPRKVPPAPASSWKEGPRQEAEETFHQENVSVLPGVLEAVCGELVQAKTVVQCAPKPDAFSPCEDLMGNWLLRLSVWGVSVAALLGNGTVLLVLLSPRRRLSVPRFLMCHLAAADLAMGAYLLMLVVMDLVSMGSYFNYAIDWQNGAGCQVAGFLTVFASELSVFTLTLLTAERWYTITFAIHMNRRLRLSSAMKIMAGGWLYSMAMAVLPLVDVSGYSVTSICLPLRSELPRDRAYLGALLAFTAVAFLVICGCYCRMYGAVRGGQDARAALQHSDVTKYAVQVAKRMTLLVLTDFACWAPIAFFGMTALMGVPLIDVPRTKILLVFFYPLNACANPYLYALLTRQFRNDLVALLSNSKVFGTRANGYKGTVGTTPRESSRRADRDRDRDRERAVFSGGPSGRTVTGGRAGCGAAAGLGALPPRPQDDSTELLEMVVVRQEALLAACPSEEDILRLGEPVRNGSLRDPASATS